MGKKPRSQLASEQLLLYRVHRECVRRNPDYNQEYERLPEHPWGEEGAREILVSAWGIRPGDELPDPQHHPSLDEALARSIPPIPASKRSPGDFVRAHPKKEIDYTGIRGSVVLDYFPEDAPGRSRCLVINLWWPKKYLMQRFEAWIDHLLRERTAAGLDQKRPQPRLRLAHYTDYLKVYDLRTKGKKFREIGDLMWPDSRGDTEKQAREYHSKGQNLVLHPPLKWIGSWYWFWT